MLISIIMPVYNNEKYFPLAVKSVVGQGYPDFELIIIDDGSTDGTPAIADGIAETDSRIKVIHQKNQWIYASFNRGIEEAKGEYIYILNSDDRLRTGSLKRMADSAERYRPDVVWTTVLTHVCDEEQNIIQYNKGRADRLVKEEAYYPDEREVRMHWPYFYGSLLAHNQANLYRSGIMKKHKFRNDVYGADTLFNISIAPDVKSALILKEPVYDYLIYRKPSMNASVGKYYPYEHDMFNEIYGRYKNMFKGWGLPEESYREVLVNFRLRQVTIELRSLSAKNCPMTTGEKLRHILCKVPDFAVTACAGSDNREEELESRLLSGMRELLVREPIEETDEMYFAYELLDSLLRYEKEEEDYRKIEKAVRHPSNPMHIGQIFYHKLEGNG